MQFKTIFGAASACAIALSAAPVGAVNIINAGAEDQALEAPVGGEADFSVFGGNPFLGTEAVFGQLSRTTDASGAFEDVFTFQIGPVVNPLETIGGGSGSISTTLFGGVGVVFDSVIFFNGVDSFEINLTNNGTGQTGSNSSIIPIFSGAENTLTVVGTSSGQSAGYNGTLQFLPVPEPGTWALMLLGFAGVGMAMRRRRKEEVRVKYAF